MNVMCLDKQLFVQLIQSVNHLLVVLVRYTLVSRNNYMHIGVREFLMHLVGDERGGDNIVPTLYDLHGNILNLIHVAGF